MQRLFDLKPSKIFLSMKIHIRPATTADAEEIANIIKAVWPENTPAGSAQIAQALRQDNQHAQVAVAEDVVVGFVSGFRTRAASGLLRWEVDLLATHPDAQGQGIGKQLVTMNTEWGLKQGVSYARSLIHVDNIASQRTFIANQYQVEMPPSTLFITDSYVHQYQISEQFVYLVPVTTFLYTGSWLELTATPPPLLHSTQLEQVAQGAIVGALLPADDEALQQAFKQNNFEAIGMYQQWVKHSK